MICWKMKHLPRPPRTPSLPPSLVDLVLEPLPPPPKTLVLGVPYLDAPATPEVSFYMGGTQPLLPGLHSAFLLHPQTKGN